MVASKSGKGMAAAQAVASEQQIAARSNHNVAMLRRAYERLGELIGQAEDGNLYGTVGIEVQFEAGRITTVRRRIDGTDK